MLCATLVNFVQFRINKSTKLQSKLLNVEAIASFYNATATKSSNEKVKISFKLILKKSEVRRTFSSFL